MNNNLITNEKSVFYYIIVIIVMGLIAYGIIKINNFIFKRFQKKRKYIYLLFLERVIDVVAVVICAIIALAILSGGLDAVWKTLLGGTAIISAVVVFAAQDVIKDFLGGLMISIFKPFEIGNRITLENNESGIVKDMTMRHVVIHTWGSQEIVIPNSKINAMKIINDSYHTGTKSYQAYFRIAYTSDIEKALKIIKKVVEESKYTVEGKKVGKNRIYDDVYFLAYEDSSLLLATTVYYIDTPTEVVKSDINLSVNKAFKKAHIEIPYPYFNIVEK